MNMWSSSHNEHFSPLFYVDVKLDIWFLWKMIYYKCMKKIAHVNILTFKLLRSINLQP